MARKPKLKLVRLGEGNTVTLADLESLQAKGGPARKRSEYLPLSAIKLAPGVFQPRLPGEDLAADEAHVRVLIKDIGVEGALDPILVMDIGGHVFNVDGHHRIDAYYNAHFKGQVPVKWHDGSLKEAVLKSSSENKKNKLAMSEASKGEKAWQLIVLGDARPEYYCTQPELTEATGTSRRTIYRMRAALRDHGDKVRSGTWKEALRVESNDIFEPDHAWLEKRAAAVAKDLMNIRGFVKNVQITARAIEICSSSLPAGLVELWADEAEASVLDRMREKDPVFAVLLEAALDKPWHDL